MKVCIIVSIFHPYTRGGAEIAAKNAAMAFKKAGDEVFVITASPFNGWKSLKPREEDWEGIKIYRFYPLNLFSFLNIGRHNLVWRLIWHVLDMFNLHSYFIVKKILKKEKPSLVLTHNLKGIGYTISCAIRIFKKLPTANCQLPTKWLHTLHDMGAIHPTGLLIYGQENNFSQKFFLARWYAKINAWLFGSPDLVISPSKFLLDFYLEHGFFPKSKKIVISNPVFSNPPSVPPLPKGETEGFSPCRFLYLGQLESYKGINLLVSTWQEFKKNHQNAELHLVGDGSLFKKISAGQDKNLFVHGAISNEKIGEILKQSSFLIVPSLAYENSPMTIAESFSCGVPVIASRLGGIPELVQEGENGFLFEPGSREDILKALNRAVLADWHTLSKKAQESAIAFSEDVYIEKIKKICSEILGDGLI